MQGSEVARAVAATMRTASSLGLTAENAVILQNSNRLTLRLLPCDVLARVAPAAHQVAAFELELCQQLLAAGCPVAGPDPRVEPRAYGHDGFVTTLWTYHEPGPASRVSAADYARALAQLHAGMRTLDVEAPHFTDRVDQARQLVSSREATPALAETDRRLLDEALRRSGPVIGSAGGADQLLHGEPHPGNVLTTTDGLLFIDLETCCRGPVEFDLAHAPEEVGEHYPGVDRRLLHECRILVLAMITAWRWDRDDQLPNGHQLATEWLGQLRTALQHGRADL